MNLIASSAKRTTATVTAGLTVAGAAAIAIAAPAQAASEATWDRLAHCESGGNWSINTGNGFYGGVQFKLSSWHAVGGKGYPHQASKAEQIKRAEKVLALQGWKAWPSCSKKLGLTAADAAGSSATPVERTSAVDTSAADRAEAQRQAAAEKAEAQRQAAAERAEAQRQAAAEKAAAERAEAQRQAAAEKAAAEKAVADRQAAAEKAAAERAEAQRQAAAEKAEADRQAAAEKAAAEKAVADRQAAAERSAAAEKAAAERAEARRQAAQQETVVVEAGDSLFSLANKHRIEGGWEAIYEANSSVIEDPNLIYVGQEFTLPRG
ncbi:resuscitation-promoting factor Rpf [Micrococcus lylae]|uniref:resuscitation-promoting factor Rpf n=1 Tax=Micrococcus lylae TaxID=1273 RepID=UPI0011AED863|nr:transglycosylase family protein [Micrococcus lylae]WIK83135.1 transglycosylase family protein [Micrococcus lylae]